MKRFVAVFFLIGLVGLGADDDPVLIAHRGLLRHAPENTLPAFASCLEFGMGFELDIRTTKDGELVVFHDANLKRTTNGGDRLLKDLTLEQVRELDAGSWFDARFAGLKVPTLRETFELIEERKRGGTMIALNVKDISEDGERRLVGLLAEFDLFGESFVFDQSEECSRRLKELDGRVRIGRNVKRDELRGQLEAGLVDAFLLPYVPDSEEVALLREHGKLVFFNYGGEGEHRRVEGNWLKAREVKIDGMLTDYALDCALLWRG